MIPTKTNIPQTLHLVDDDFSVDHPVVRSDHRIHMAISGWELSLRSEMANIFLMWNGKYVDDVPDVDRDFGHLAVWPANESDERHQIA
jgi:hypothetical protein